MRGELPTPPPRKIHALLQSRTADNVPHPATGRFALDRWVFGITAAAAIAFVLWGIISTPSLSSVSSNAQSWVIDNTGWLFVLATSFFVVFVIFRAASRYGRIKLGADDERPAFKTASWIAMMFSAGMGIGLMFFGAPEPLSFFMSPPPGTAEAGTDAALRTAMATTMFHWKLHPWAIYAIVAIAIAYGTFRKGRRQLISQVFRPILGRKSERPIGKIIDILAIFATLFGSAASLGLGALQIGAGLKFNGWSDCIGTFTLAAIIAVLTLAFMASAVSVIAKGIQYLSNINMVLALLLAVFVFVAGPTLLILNLLPTTLGTYLSDMGHMASRTSASGGEAMAQWMSNWTLFYWAWWISWTPFVAMFIARISRGRIIREFVTGVLLVPTVVSVIWFSIFGGAAIDQQRTVGGIAAADGSVNSETALFLLLDHLPLAGITTVLVMVLVAIFFVSGADSASIVMGTLSEGGNLEPRRKTVIFWLS